MSGEVDVAWFWEDPTDPRVALLITFDETALRWVTAQDTYDHMGDALDVALPCEQRIDIAGGVSMISEDSRLRESLLMTVSIGGFDNGHVHAGVKFGDHSDAQAVTIQLIPLGNALPELDL